MVEVGNQEDLNQSNNELKKSCGDTLHTDAKSQESDQRYLKSGASLTWKLKIEQLKEEMLSYLSVVNFHSGKSTSAVVFAAVDCAVASF